MKISKDINNNIHEKILEICNLNSEECFNEIKISIDKKILKKNIDIYYKYINGKWNKCNIDEAIEFMTENFSRRLVDLKNDFNANQNDIQMIDKIIDKWKNGSINKYQIFKKLTDNLCVNDINDINKIDNLNNKPIKNNTDNKSNSVKIKILNNEGIENLTNSKIKIKKMEVIGKIIKEFFDLYIIITTDINDFILATDFYNNFIIWCDSKNYFKYDIRIIGRTLKSLGINIAHTHYGNKYLNMKFK